MHCSLRVRYHKKHVLNVSSTILFNVLPFSILFSFFSFLFASDPPSAYRKYYTRQYCAVAETTIGHTTTSTWFLSATWLVNASKPPSEHRISSRTITRVHRTHGVPRIITVELCYSSLRADLGSSIDPRQDSSFYRVPCVSHEADIPNCFIDHWLRKSCDKWTFVSQQQSPLPKTSSRSRTLRMYIYPHM